MWTHFCCLYSSQSRFGAFSGQQTNLNNCCCGGTGQLADSFGWQWLRVYRAFLVCQSVELWKPSSCCIPSACAWTGCSSCSWTQVCYCCCWRCCCWHWTSFEVGTWPVLCGSGLRWWLLVFRPQNLALGSQNWRQQLPWPWMACCPTGWSQD